MIKLLAISMQETNFEKLFLQKKKHFWERNVEHLFEMLLTFIKAYLLHIDSQITYLAVRKGHMPIDNFNKLTKINFWMHGFLIFKKCKNISRV